MTVFYFEFMGNESSTSSRARTRSPSSTVGGGLSGSNESSAKMIRGRRKNRGYLDPMSSENEPTMNIIVRGPRGVGKSQLLRNLRGETSLVAPGADENPWIGDRIYNPTLENEHGTIKWSYKTSDEVIRVKICAVVDSDKSVSRRELYKEAHACVILLDLRRKETLQYAKREAACIPSHVRDILVLANFRDCIRNENISGRTHGDVVHDKASSNLPVGSSTKAQRAISAKDLAALVDEIRTGVRLQDDADEKKDNQQIEWKARGDERTLLEHRTVHAVECSLRNGYGLRVLRSYLNLPFLRMQYAATLAQSQNIKAQLVLAREEVRSIPSFYNLQFS